MAVYFIQHGENGPIKIGVSKNPASRLKSMQTGCPDKLVLIGIRDGGFELESALHTRLGKYRLCGEWFSPSAEVISSLSDPMPEINKEAAMTNNPVANKRDWHKLLSDEEAIYVNDLQTKISEINTRISHLAARLNPIRNRAIQRVRYQDRVAS